MPPVRAENGENNHHEKLDHGVRDMFSAITNRIFHGHNIGSSNDGEDGRGVRVIMLAGNNTGATLRGAHEAEKTHEDGEDDENGEEVVGTYVNSNFQAINNSIMMGGSYEANDPGVHAEITDFFEHKEKHKKKDNKKKKKIAESE